MMMPRRARRADSVPAVPDDAQETNDAPAVLIVCPPFLMMPRKQTTRPPWLFAYLIYINSGKRARRADSVPAVPDDKETPAVLIVCRG